ncbi:unnamed protein product, partial [Mesorhabditis spiculigera]
MIISTKRPKLSIAAIFLRLTTLIGCCNKNEMFLVKLALLASIFALGVLGGDEEDERYCDDGWTYHDDACYKFIHKPEKVEPGVSLCPLGVNATNDAAIIERVRLSIAERMFKEYFLLCLASTAPTCGLLDGKEIFSCNKPDSCTSERKESKLHVVLCQIDLKAVDLSGTNEELERRMEAEKDGSFARRRQMLLERWFRGNAYASVVFVWLFLVCFALGTAYLNINSYRNAGAIFRDQQSLKRTMESVLQNVALVEVDEMKRQQLFLETLAIGDWSRLQEESKADLQRIDRQFGVAPGELPPK